MCSTGSDDEDKDEEVLLFAVSLDKRIDIRQDGWCRQQL